MSLLSTRDTFRPTQYQWALDYWRKQQEIHWLVGEINLQSDVRDWVSKLKPGARNLLSQLFRFFVQGDVDVASGYHDKLIPVLGGQPEVKMMMSSFANMETVHIDAYDKLLQTVGMDDSEYTAFKKLAPMLAKHDYIGRFVPVAPVDGKLSDDDLRTLIKTLAVYSAFTEGLQLFSSFAILLNFARFQMMMGMATIVEWSIRDETLHCQAMCHMTRVLIAENPHIWTDEFRAELYQIAREMVKLEDDFVDLCWEQAGEIDGLTPQEMKRYNRYIADNRLFMLGLKANYGAYNVNTNPTGGENLPWIDWMLGEGHTNFFEKRETEYSKGKERDFTAAGAWD
jgi:ribonucleoside-diphosphate reductase beta chain